MKRSLLATMAICGLLVAAPVVAGGGMQKDSQSVMQIQEKLKQQGFDVGEADGKWGPKTAEALKDFQEKEGLQASGELDQETLDKLGVQTTGASGSSQEVGSGSSMGSGSSSDDKSMGSGSSQPSHSGQSPPSADTGEKKQ
jgi:peptidoglycan hydrolase-like protein with peptidoglycan-binding domain